MRSQSLFSIKMEKRECRGRENRLQSTADFERKMANLKFMGKKKIHRCAWLYPTVEVQIKTLTHRSTGCLGSLFTDISDFSFQMADEEEGKEQKRKIKKISRCM